MNNTIKEVQKGSVSKRIKFLVKDSALYGGAGALSKMLHVFLIPLLARVFTKEEYGVVDAISVIGNLLIPFIIFGLDSATARFFYEKDENSYKKQIMTDALVFQLFFSIIVSGLVLIFSKQILESYLGTDKYAYELKVLALSLPFFIIVRFTINLLKWTFQRVMFLIISLGTPFFVILVTIIFVKVFGTEIKYVFYAQLLGQFLFAIISFIIVRKHLLLISSFNYLKPLLKYGSPLMITIVVNALVPAIDRYYVNNTFGMEMLGVYAIAVKTASISQLAINGFKTAWGPLSFSVHQEKDAEKTYNKVLKLYAIFLLAFSFIFTVFIKYIVLILASEKYLNAIPIIIPIMFSLIINSLSGITALGISLSKKTHLFLISNFIYLLFTFIFIRISISYFNVEGVAYAVMLGQIVHIIAATIFAQKSHKITFDFLKPILLLLISILFSVVYINFIELVLYKVIFICLFVVVMVVLLWFYILESDEKNKIIKYIKL